MFLFQKKKYTYIHTYILNKTFGCRYAKLISNVVISFTHFSLVHIFNARMLALWYRIQLCHPQDLATIPAARELGGRKLDLRSTP